MSKKDDLLPPIHPGEILIEEFMKPLGLSTNGTTPEIWMNLQSAYDLEVAERDSKATIERDVHPCGSVA